MRLKFTRIVLIGVLLLIPCIASAQYTEDITPHRVHVKIQGTDGYPVAVTAIGCAWSDYPAPTNYDFVEGCQNCYQYLCVFPEDEMHPVEGAYIVASTYLSMTLDPSSVVYGQVYPGGIQHIFGMWYTVELGEGNEWEEIHSMLVTVDGIGAVTPTPEPTLTPFPTPTAPATPDISTGFGAGFDESYGTLSGSGALPAWGIDVDTWLFYGRKVIAMINRGNLLYIVGGILMAALVLAWAIEQVKNPR